MAKQCGAVKVVGTIDNITFYQMGEKFYGKKKSSLTAKDFWKKDCFEASRKSSRRFAEGNRLASRVYRWLELSQRKYCLFCRLKQLAIAMLKEGIEEETINLALIDYGLTYNEAPAKQRVKKEKRKAKLAYAKQVRKNEVVFTAGKLRQYLEKRGLLHTSFFTETGVQGLHVALMDKLAA